MKILRFMFLVMIMSLIFTGCSNKNKNGETEKINESDKTVDISPTETEGELEKTNEEKLKEVSGKVIIEMQSVTDQGIYLNWYVDNELYIGLLKSDMMTEYGYPGGTKVNIHAVMDGNSKTESGEECWSISSIDYTENIDFETEYSDEDINMEYLEGVVYVEEMFQKENNTYIKFGFEFEPNTYYVAEMNSVSYDMTGSNYYFYIVYEPGKVLDGTQYCVISSWDNYEYEMPDVNNGYIEVENDYSEQNPIQLDVNYDASYYDQSTGIWLLGNTQMNGCPIKISGFDEISIEDGYLYFLGKLENKGEKLIKAYLNVSLYSKQGGLIDKFEKVSAFTYNPIYSERKKSTNDYQFIPEGHYVIKGKNTINDNYDEEGDGTNFYEIPNSEFFSAYLSPKSSALFGFGTLYSSAVFTDFTQFEDNGEIRVSDYDIFNSYYLRKLNCEVGYIYVTINDYKIIE